MDRRSWVLALGLAGGAAVGCASTAQDGNLQVKVLAATSETPSNVALHLSVGSKSGQPVVGLKPANFRIFEDGKLVSEEKAQRALLDPKVAELHFTMLLIDLSGPIVESEDFPELVQQVGQFIERVRGTNQMMVSVFDGRDDLRTVLEPDETDIETGLARIRRYRPEDRKGNLNGAILKGLAALDRQLAASEAIQKTSNLVVFTDRGDLALKVPEEELEVALDKTPADVYVIAAGPGINKPELGKIARTDAFYSKATKDLGTGFTQLAKHLEVTGLGHYLLSYCSPKRKGEHEVEIEVVTETEHGKLSHRFSAAGFKKGCSPKHRPAFADKSQPKQKGDGVDDNASAKDDVQEGGQNGTQNGGQNGARDGEKVQASVGRRRAAVAADPDATGEPAADDDRPRKPQGKQDRKRDGNQDKDEKAE